MPTRCHVCFRPVDGGDTDVFVSLITSKWVEVRMIYLMILETLTGKSCFATPFSLCERSQAAT